MYTQSKSVSRLMLGIISIACSRVVLSLVDDPEGPNLLVVIGLSIIIYILILAVRILYKMYNK